MVLFILAVLGLCFGSFANALVWRIHQQHLPKKKRAASDQDLSIAKGRSMCPHCQHVLSARDLVPVVSWLLLRGKCRYCQKSISWQYPTVELLTAILFIASFSFWPYSLEGVVDYSIFGLWLVSLVGLIALIIYDLRWMLLPNRIVFPLTGLAILYAVLRATQVNDLTQSLLGSLGGLLVAGGIFYVLFQLSGGKWIGGGDVKLGFALGLLLGTPVLGFLMLFLASVLGLLTALPAIFTAKKQLTSRIPFGPFLIVATIAVELFGQSIIDWYIGTVLYL